MTESRLVDVSEPVIVRTPAGALRGQRSDGVNAFLGIPYAAPPFGRHRMRRPQPVQPWTGIRPATRYGPTVPKGDYPAIYRPYFHEVVIPGEDCLNLNVWTPDLGDARLPVFVWIHGGSFANGSGSIREYAGWAFARDGVVSVTINYRLGLEGFLYYDDGDANLGLRDQIAALEWVQDNIAAFGGDPGTVTVAGQSAGAMSVTTLLAAPRAAGLFSRAIAQSGFAVDTLTPAQASRVGTYVAASCGTEDSREGLRELPPRELASLSAALVEELEFHPDADKWGDLAAIGSPFSPTVDGDILPCNPLEAFHRGNGSDVDVLIGSNRDEVRLSMVAAETLEEVSVTDLYAGAAGLGLSADAVDTYRRIHSSTSPGDVLAAVWTDWIYTLSPIRVAEARQRAEKTWLYLFEHPEPRDNGGLGACHGAEMPFVFDCVELPEVRPRIGDSPRQAVADLVHRIWVDFVRDGAPGWRPYSLVDRQTALIGEKLAAVADPFQVQRLAWEGVR